MAAVRYVSLDLQREGVASNFLASGLKVMLPMAMLSTRGLAVALLLLLVVLAMHAASWIASLHCGCRFKPGKQRWPVYTLCAKVSSCRQICAVPGTWIVAPNLVLGIIIRRGLRQCRSALPHLSLERS